MKHEGELDNFFETGCEGIIWIICENGKRGYAAIINIENGDHLKVYGADNQIIFDDVIKQDHKVGYKEYPYYPGHGQPCALGYWVHWTQAGWQPDDWAKLFFNVPRLKAELTKNSK